MSQETNSFSIPSSLPQSPSPSPLLFLSNHDPLISPGHSQTLNRALSRATESRARVCTYPRSAKVLSHLASRIACDVASRNSPKQPTTHRGIPLRMSILPTAARMGPCQRALARASSHDTGAGGWLFGCREMETAPVFLSRKKQLQWRITDLQNRFSLLKPRFFCRSHSPLFSPPPQPDSKQLIAVAFLVVRLKGPPSPSYVGPAKNIALASRSSSSSCSHSCRRPEQHANKSPRPLR